MEEQIIISGVARIWVEGMKRGVDCEDRDHWRIYGRQIRPWPLNVFHNISREISTTRDNTGIVLNYIQFRNFIYRFQNKIKDLANHMCLNLFILLQCVIFFSPGFKI